MKDILDQRLFFVDLNGEMTRESNGPWVSPSKWANEHMVAPPFTFPKGERYGKPGGAPVDVQVMR